jgi:hypothetical protein
MAGCGAAGSTVEANAVMLLVAVVRLLLLLLWRSAFSELLLVCSSLGELVADEEGVSHEHLLARRLNSLYVSRRDCKLQYYKKMRKNQRSYQSTLLKRETSMKISNPVNNVLNSSLYNYFLPAKGFHK